MAKKDAIAKIENMIGKDWMYMGNQHHFLSFKEEHSKVIITTDRFTITKPIEQIEDFVWDCLPVNRNDKLKTVATTQAAPAQQTNYAPTTQQRPIAVEYQFSVASKETIQLLKDTLLDNIQRVKENKEYIAQAIQINKEVNSIIELAKTEVDIFKLNKSIK